MAIYTKESLERLKSGIDLVEVLSSHVQFQRAGSSHKACCPFHEEKTPSFVVQRGDTHYHCFGCGAHGDAIAFLMQQLQMSFTEAIEYLSDRFQIPLERVEKIDDKMVNRTLLRNCLEKGAELYHFFLLHSKEGEEALDYLYKRGIDLEFIQQFQIGYALRSPKIFRSAMHALGFDDQLLQEVGLISSMEGGKKKDFFIDRITFPIRDAPGFVIGFSARKYRENTFGGKYINTAETVLFKKSHVLFGLSYSRRRIVKEKKAILVEGQIDALRLIKEKLTYTVALQGTAFGDDHVKEFLHLGVTQVFLALDSDDAGLEAMVKIGDLFQKKGVEVSIVMIPQGYDPDEFVQEKGIDAFGQLLHDAKDYLTFLYSHLSSKVNLQSPSEKSALVNMIATKIRVWENEIMVFESLKKLSKIASVPEEMIGIKKTAAIKPYVQRRGKIHSVEVDYNEVLETDLVRWLVIIGENEPKLVELIHRNLSPSHFHHPRCNYLYKLYLEMTEKGEGKDLLSISLKMESDEDRLFLDQLLKKKIPIDRAFDCIKDTIEKLLIRDWMEKSELIKVKIQSGLCSDDEVLELAKEFDQIKKQKPQVAID